MARPSKYSPKVRERFVRLVQEHTSEHGSHGRRLPPSRRKLAELKRLQREVVELKRANEILKKASAYFAQAELDRRGK